MKFGLVTLGSIALAHAGTHKSGTFMQHQASVNGSSLVNGTSSNGTWASNSTGTSNSSSNSSESSTGPKTATAKSSEHASANAAALSGSAFGVVVGGLFALLI